MRVVPLSDHPSALLRREHLEEREEELEAARSSNRSLMASLNARN